jgi:transcriptional regulator with XRE-family HTH domain
MFYSYQEYGYAPAMTGLGETIRRLRKPQMTQEELAKQMGLGQSAISQWETGESIPNAIQMVKLAVVLKCPIDEIVKGYDGTYDKTYSAASILTRGIQGATTSTPTGGHIAAHSQDRQQRQALKDAADLIKISERVREIAIAISGRQVTKPSRSESIRAGRNRTTRERTAG